MSNYLRKYLSKLKPQEHLPASVLRTLLRGWVVFVLLMSAVAEIEYLRNGGQHYWEPVFWECSSAFIGGLLFYLQSPFLFDRDLHATTRKWFFVQIGFVSIASVVFVVTEFALRRAVYSLLGLNYPMRPWVELLPYEALRFGIFAGLFILVIFGVMSYAELQREKQSRIEAQLLLRETHLQILSAQMQPHFLFNALNTISALLYEDIRQADRALSALGTVLRSALSMQQHTLIPLQQELEMLQAYAELMAFRFSERVNLQWKIDDASLDIKIPPYSVQTLLENTYKHTVSRRSERVNIQVVAEYQEGQLRITVSDDLGVYQPAPGHKGIGLLNLKSRLQNIFADQASLKIQQREQGGVLAEINIKPIKWAQE